MTVPLEQDLRDFYHQLRTYKESLDDARFDIPLATVLRDLPAWLSHQKPRALARSGPWITFGARRALERIVTPASRVFEYGAGGSTLWLAQRAASVVSVEHDAEWFAAISAAASKYSNVELLLVEPEPTPEVARRMDVSHYTSSDQRYQGMWFREYVRTIERFPDGHFDLVIVDGRARVEAFVHGARKVRAGGSILLDDSDRSTYADALSAVRGWPRSSFRGPKPYAPKFAETSIWQRPSR